MVGVGGPAQPSHWCVVGRRRGRGWGDLARALGVWGVPTKIEYEPPCTCEACFNKRKMMNPGDATLLAVVPRSVAMMRAREAARPRLDDETSWLVCVAETCLLGVCLGTMLCALIYVIWVVVTADAGASPQIR